MLTFIHEEPMQFINTKKEDLYSQFLIEGEKELFINVMSEGLITSFVIKKENEEAQAYFINCMSTYED